MKRFLLTLLLVLGATGSAAARKHRLAKPTLVVKEATTNKGAKVDSTTGVNPEGLMVPPRVRLFKTFVEFHSDRVENDLMMFQPTLIGLTPAGRARTTELLARRQAKFVVPSKAADDLEVRRDRDRLLLFRDPQPQGGAIGIGLAMFGATTIMSAHAPRPLRILLDGPLHLGPAIFDGGGMGAGIAGRGL